MGVLQNGWCIRENPKRMDEHWGYPHLWNPPDGKQSRQHVVYCPCRKYREARSWRRFHTKTCSSCLSSTTPVSFCLSWVIRCSLSTAGSFLVAAALGVSHELTVYHCTKHVLSTCIGFIAISLKWYWVSITTHWTIWGFPEIGIPTKSSISTGFSLRNHKPSSY